MYLVFARQMIRQQLAHRCSFDSRARRWIGRWRHDQLRCTGLEFFQGQFKLGDLAIDLFRGATELLALELGNLQLQVFDEDVAVLELAVSRFKLLVCGFDLVMGGVQCRATLDHQSL